MLHSSGRWRRGSHWPKSSRKLKIRSFARARSSSRRAPPNAASKPCSSSASSRATVWRRLREARGPVPPLTRLGGGARAGLLLDAAGVDRPLHRGDDELDPEPPDLPVAVLDDLGEVVPRVD